MDLRICCWQPLLTAHQGHTFAALAALPGVKLRVIASRKTDSSRSGQGWRTDETFGCDVEYLPNRGWRRRVGAILEETADWLHLFGSPFELSKQSLALAMALSKRRKIFLLSEPYSTTPHGYLSDANPLSNHLRARLRPLVYRLYGALIHGRIMGVFAISTRAAEQFGRLGLDRERIFKFGYFVPPLKDSRKPVSPHRGPLRVAYVGSFIKRKGVEVVLQAIADPSICAEVMLDLYGPPPPPRELPANATFRGNILFGGSQGTFAGYDLAVAPSFHDGWAVVVNEAIAAGVPVLASDAVGAADMLKRWQCGLVVKAGSSAAFTEALQRLVSTPAMLRQLQSATAQLAPLLHPTVAAEYLRDCITSRLTDAIPPDAPWY